MVCLFHSDYGPADPAFKFDPRSTVGVRGWIVGASSFKEARNIGEVEAIQRQLLAETLAPVGPQGPPARRSARLVTVAARARGSLLWTTGTSCDCACNRRSFKKETACHSRAPSRQSSGTKHFGRALSRVRPMRRIGPAADTRQSRHRPFHAGLSLPVSPADGLGRAGNDGR
jgi:hypothetical protein